MAEFDKKKYWDRRNKGLSGQEKPVISTLVQPVAPALNRRKVVDRRFTKKGYTHVIKVEDDGSISRHPTKVGSPLHKKAVKNAKAYRSGRIAARGA